MLYIQASFDKLIMNFNLYLHSSITSIIYFINFIKTFKNVFYQNTHKFFATPKLSCVGDSVEVGKKRCYYTPPSSLSNGYFCVTS